MTPRASRSRWARAPRRTSTSSAAWARSRLTPFSATATDEKSQNFVKAYGDAHNGEIPNQFAADTYDVLYAMQLAADDAKITPDMENADISAAMSASMANIELDGLTGKAKWTEDGECDKEPKAFEIKDGAYVEMK